MSMTENSTTALESPRAPTRCCGCLGGQWLGKRPPAEAKVGGATGAEATQQGWETTSPTLLPVPPSSPASLGSSAVPDELSGRTTPTSPLDDENLDLGFFTKEHRASFAPSDDIDGLGIRFLDIEVPLPGDRTPPSKDVDRLGVDVDDSCFSEGSQLQAPTDAAQAARFAATEYSEDPLPQLQGPLWDRELSAVAQAPAADETLAVADERPASPSGRPPHDHLVPRLIPPGHDRVMRTSREHKHGLGEAAGEGEVEEHPQAAPEPHRAVPLLMTPDQFRVQKQKEKAEESVRAKHALEEEDARHKAETSRHAVPILASPEEFHARQRASQEEAEAEAARQASAVKLKEPKVVIPRLHPPLHASSSEAPWIRSPRSHHHDEQQNEPSDELNESTVVIPKLHPPVPSLAGHLAAANLQYQLDPARRRQPESHHDKRQDESEEAGQSPRSSRYVELASRDPENTKLSTLRGLKSELLLLLEWSQLRANALEASVAGLSEELTQQQGAYLDLQARHLAQIGINLPTPSPMTTTILSQATLTQED